jgi:hypothetical protein
VDALAAGGSITPIEEYEVLQLQMVLKLQHLVGGEAQLRASPTQQHQH